MTRLQRRLTATFSTGLALLALSAGVASAAPADLDPTFDLDGVTHDAVSGLFSQAGQPLADQAPDGSLVAATPIEAIDPCFIGGRGDGPIPCTLRSEAPDHSIKVIRTNASGGVIERLELLDTGEARLLDLRVLGAGAGTTTLVANVDGRLGVVRLGGALADNDEKQLSTVNGSEICASDARAVAGATLIDAEVRSDGTIVAAWECSDGSLVVEARRLDDTDHLVRVAGFDASPIGNLPCSASNVELSPTDGIYVLCTGQGWYVLKIGSGGQLDGGYGTGGIAIGELGNVVGSGPMAAGPDGSVIVADLTELDERGSSETWRLMRMAPGGVQDEAFGEDGFAVATSPQINDRPAELTVQSNGRILAVGYETGPRPTPIRLGPIAFQERGLVIARFLSDGERDLSWDGDALVLLEVVGRRLDEPGPITQQADGKLVLPALVPGLSILSRDADRPNPGSNTETFLSLFRFEGDPPPIETTVAQQGAAAQSQGNQRKSCVSKRKLRIRLRTGRRKAERSRIVSARVLVNGRSVKVTRGNRLRARINLSSLPKGRFAVKIRLRLADGGIVRETRRYRTCTKKIRRQLKPLRTRAPRSSRG